MAAVPRFCVKHNVSNNWLSTSCVTRLFIFLFFFLDFFPPSFVSDQLICYNELPKMETAESDQM